MVTPAPTPPEGSPSRAGMAGAAAKARLGRSMRSGSVLFGTDELREELEHSKDQAGEPGVQSPVLSSTPGPKEKRGGTQKQRRSVKKGKAKVKHSSSTAKSSAQSRQCTDSSDSSEEPSDSDFSSETETDSESDVDSDSSSEQTEDNAFYGSEFVYDSRDFKKPSQVDEINEFARQYKDDPLYKLKGLQDDTLVFESRFEGGNLQRAMRRGGSSTEYDVLIDFDNDEDTKPNGWFFFSVSNVEKDTVYTINIMNATATFKNQLFRRIFRFAMFSTVSESWTRLKTKPTIERNFMFDGHGNRLFTVSFKFRPAYGGDTIFLAPNPPYSFSHLKARLQHLKQKYKGQSDGPSPKPDIIQETALSRSPGGNPVQMVTITDPGPAEQQMDKKVAVLVGRTRASDVASSWAMDGFMEFLCSPDPVACALRRNMIFVMVPMLCVDGVVAGHVTTNDAGKDLKQEWKRPSLAKSPEVLAVKHLLRTLVVNSRNGSNEVILFSEICGMSSRRNMQYDCCRNGVMTANVYLREQMLPKYFSEILPWFGMSDCRFEVPEPDAYDSFACVWKEFEVVNSFRFGISSYGLEKSRYDAVNKDNAEQLPTAPQFNPSDFQEIGKKLAEAFAAFAQWTMFSSGNSSPSYVPSGALSKLKQAMSSAANSPIQKAWVPSSSTPIVSSPPPALSPSRRILTSSSSSRMLSPTNDNVGQRSPTSTTPGSTSKRMREIAAKLRNSIKDSTSPSSSTSAKGLNSPASLRKMTGAIDPSKWSGWGGSALGANQDYVYMRRNEERRMSGLLVAALSNLIIGDLPWERMRPGSGQDNEGANEILRWYQTGRGQWRKVYDQPEDGVMLLKHPKKRRKRRSKGSKQRHRPSSNSSSSNDDEDDSDSTSDDDEWDSSDTQSTESEDSTSDSELEDDFENNQLRTRISADKVLNDYTVDSSATNESRFLLSPQRAVKQKDKIRHQIRENEPSAMQTPMLSGNKKLHARQNSSTIAKSSSDSATQQLSERQIRPPAVSIQSLQEMPSRTSGRTNLQTNSSTGNHESHIISLNSPIQSSRDSQQSSMLPEQAGAREHALHPTSLLRAASGFSTKNEGERPSPKENQPSDMDWLALESKIRLALKPLSVARPNEICARIMTYLQGLHEVSKANIISAIDDFISELESGTIELDMLRSSDVYDLKLGKGEGISELKITGRASPLDLRVSPRQFVSKHLPANQEPTVPLFEVSVHNNETNSNKFTAPGPQISKESSSSSTAQQMSVNIRRRPHSARSSTQTDKVTLNRSFSDDVFVDSGESQYAQQAEAKPGAQVTVGTTSCIEALSRQEWDEPIRGALHGSTSPSAIFSEQHSTDTQFPSRVVATNSSQVISKSPGQKRANNRVVKTSPVSPNSSSRSLGDNKQGEQRRGRVGRVLVVGKGSGKALHNDLDRRILSRVGMSYEHGTWAVQEGHSTISSTQLINMIEKQRQKDHPGSQLSPAASHRPAVASIDNKTTVPLSKREAILKRYRTLKQSGRLSEAVMTEMLVETALQLQAIPLKAQQNTSTDVPVDRKREITSPPTSHRALTVLADMLDKVNNGQDATSSVNNSGRETMDAENPHSIDVLETLEENLQGSSDRWMDEQISQIAKEGDMQRPRKGQHCNEVDDGRSFLRGMISQMAVDMTDDMRSALRSKLRVLLENGYDYAAESHVGSVQPGDVPPGDDDKQKESKDLAGSSTRNSKAITHEISRKQTHASSSVRRPQSATTISNTHSGSSAGAVETVVAGTGPAGFRRPLFVSHAQQRMHEFGVLVVDPTKSNGSHLVSSPGMKALNRAAEASDSDGDDYETLEQESPWVMEKRRAFSAGPVRKSKKQLSRKPSAQNSRALELGKDGQSHLTVRMPISDGSVIENHVTGTANKKQQSPHKVANDSDQGKKPLFVPAFGMPLCFEGGIQDYNGIMTLLEPDSLSTNNGSAASTATRNSGENGKLEGQPEVTTMSRPCADDLKLDLTAVELLHNDDKHPSQTNTATDSRRNASIASEACPVSTRVGTPRLLYNTDQMPSSISHRQAAFARNSHLHHSASSPSDGHRQQTPFDDTAKQAFAGRPTIATPPSKPKSSQPARPTTAGARVVKPSVALKDKARIPSQRPASARIDRRPGLDSALRNRDMSSVSTPFNPAQMTSPQFDVIANSPHKGFAPPRRLSNSKRPAGGPLEAPILKQSAFCPAVGRDERGHADIGSMTMRGAGGMHMHWSGSIGREGGKSSSRKGRLTRRQLR